STPCAPRLQRGQREDERQPQLEGSAHTTVCARPGPSRGHVPSAGCAWGHDARVCEAMTRAIIFARRASPCPPTPACRRASRARVRGRALRRHVRRPDENETVEPFRLAPTTRTLRTLQLEEPHPLALWSKRGLTTSHVGTPSPYLTARALFDGFAPPPYSRLN